MRIAVDGRHGSGGRGVARYSLRMLEALRAQAPSDEVVAVEGDRARFALAALTGRPRLDRMAGGADVVWAPAPAPLAVSRGVPLVVTIHDLSWQRRTGDFTPYERLWHRAARIDRLVARAAAVVCDTRAVAAEVRARWGVEPAVVVPGPGLAGGPAPLPTLAERPGDTARAVAAGRSSYFLAVGALEPRKAPGLLVGAHAAARARGLRARLVFAGRGRVPVSGDGVEVIAPADDELAALYAGALAVVQPAHLEGFGFPPVEGLAHGTPAIVADLPVYDETIGGGALRVAPGDEAALADALLRMEREPELRARLAAAGRAAVAALSWERAARELRAVLAGAAGR